MSKRINIFLLILNVLLFLSSLGQNGWTLRKPCFRRDGELISSFRSGTGAQLFAADGFIVLRTAEDGSDGRILEYGPVEGNRSMNILAGCNIHVDGYKDFHAEPGMAYFLINGNIYQCPAVVNKYTRDFPVGLLE